ncbi:hypothetical protein WJX81_002493 [Elliptochloris bilobata]|uniref:Uncharacterized protein n=1 Tax=Elliptochloris bilobata TaxID=381761 RepID=A0AAW1RZB5_9CHLO
MLELLPTFEPQGLSMIAYGFSQLEYVPQGAALDRLCAAALPRLPEFRSQATSNLLYGLARLDHYPAALCSAAEEHVVSSIVSYRPQELSNLLWAFVKFRHIPRRFIAALEARLGDPELTARMQSSSWAVLVWAAATLGVELQVKELGIEYSLLQPVAGRTLMVDIAFQREGARPVALQVVGPHETARSGELLGGPRAAARLLSLHGWDVVYLPVDNAVVLTTSAVTSLMPTGTTHLHLWSIIKDMIGKDVLAMSLPSELLLPCTELQKQAEELEYSELLDQAAEQPKGSIERLLLVAAFSVSPYATCLRTQRSFNPVLGETFELIYPEKGFRLLSEHVTRVPPVCAIHAEGRGWRFDAENEPHVWFWGASIDLNMNFVLQVTFDDGDQFIYTKVKASIGNIIMGKPIVNHTGTFRVENKGNGLAAVMELVKPPLLSMSSKKRSLHEVRGYLEQNGQKLAAPTIYGNWDKAVYASLGDGSERQLFAVNEVAEKRWGFSRLLIHCNDVTPGLLERLPPTDSRRRADIRALEACKADQANAAKAEIEERQRAARQQAKKSGVPEIEALPPKWFEPDPNAAAAALGKALRWRYKEGSYWSERARGDWSSCRQLFDGI